MDDFLDWRDGWGVCGNRTYGEPLIPAVWLTSLPNPFRLWPGLSSCVFACFGCSNLSVFSFRHRSLVWCAILRCGQANGTRTERNGSRDSIERPPLILLYRVVYTQSPIHETIEKEGHLITATKKKSKRENADHLKNANYLFSYFLFSLSFLFFLFRHLIFFNLKCIVEGHCDFPFLHLGFVPCNSFQKDREQSPNSPLSLRVSCTDLKDLKTWLTHVSGCLPCDVITSSSPDLYFHKPQKERERERIFLRRL